MVWPTNPTQLWSLTVTSAFFYCDCLTSRNSACLSTAAAMLSQSHEITSKNDNYSLFFLCREGSGESVHLHRLTWVFVLVLKYHVLAQITIYVLFIRTMNAVVRLHQQPQEFCATISALYQCVKKMLPVRCNKNSSIKHLLVYQEKNPK